MDKIRMIYEIILNTAMTVLARARPTRMETLNYRQLQDHPVGYPIWQTDKLSYQLLSQQFTLLCARSANGDKTYNTVWDDRHQLLKFTITAKRLVDLQLSSNEPHGEWSPVEHNFLQVQKPIQLVSSEKEWYWCLFRKW